MTRMSTLVLTLVGAVAAGGVVMLAGQTPQDPQFKPGAVTQARVVVINKGPKEAIPVTLDSGSDAVRVQVAGTTAVQISGTPNVQARVTRQMWEYRQLVLPAGQDPTAALNAAGLDGWEATGIALSMVDATRIILKRPTDR